MHCISDEIMIVGLFHKHLKSPCMIVEAMLDT